MSTSSGGGRAASAEEVAAVIAGTAPRGFRFAVTKAADVRAPPGLDKQIYEAAWNGKKNDLLNLCLDWAGHPVIDKYKNNVSLSLIAANVNINTNMLT